MDEGNAETIPQYQQNHDHNYAAEELENIMQKQHDTQSGEVYSANVVPTTTNTASNSNEQRDQRAEDPAPTKIPN